MGRHVGMRKAKTYLETDTFALAEAENRHNFLPPQTPVPNKSLDKIMLCKTISAAKHRKESDLDKYRNYALSTSSSPDSRQR